MEEAISEESQSNLERSARDILDEHLDLDFDDVIAAIVEDAGKRLKKSAKETKLQTSVNLMVGNYMKQQMSDVSGHGFSNLLGKLQNFGLTFL